MIMITLKKVGHIAMRVPDPARAAKFYAETLGFDLSGQADGVMYLRCGADHHCAVFYPVQHGSPWAEHIPQTPGLHHIAFEVGNREELDKAAEVLRRQGVTIVAGPGKCEELGVEHVLRFLDPEGRCVELYCGMEQLHDGNRSLSPIRPKKLSHFNLTSKNWEETSKFYLDILGFKVSDWIKDVGVFMRCAPEYHSLVFMRAKDNAVNHCMYEVDGYAAFMRAAEIIHERTVQIVNGPGRHGPGRALYLYCKDSEGNTFELGCEEQQIHDEDHWTPRVLLMEDARINLWEGRVPEALRQ
jgi:catechol 2,3-dioxygenase-like lactoylglutathione lyase family enzyme